MKRPIMMVAGVLATLALIAAACGSNKPAAPTGKTTGATGTPSPSFSTLKPGVLQVGSCLDYPPFERVKNGVEEGFDVDMTDAIAQRLGLKVEWVRADFDTIFTAVAGGQFDMVAAASTITKKREQTVTFSDPYYNSRQSLTVNEQQTPDIKTTDDLKSGDVIGVQKGTTGEAWAEENLQPKGIQIKSYVSATDAFRDLEGGGITGIINDEPASDEIVKQAPSLKVVQAIDT
ncbi:MAG TPA: transporter substrate-binding domain-containing protein, partial [Actinomycetota bacterium]|nr:transporter substrate-binding domain-containing protein [Actinomycetota bacterium]